jgi:hypothetical protein
MFKVGEWRKKSVEERLKLICQHAAENYSKMMAKASVK